MAILCAVGDGLRRDPRLAARILGALERFPLRMVSQAASRRNVTVVLQDSVAGAAMNHLHERFFARAVAPQRSGPVWRRDGLAADCRSRQDGPPGRSAGARLRIQRRRHRGRGQCRAARVVAEGGRGDRFLAGRGACPTNLPMLAARGMNIVIGTTGWQAQEAGLAPRRRRDGIGVVAAPNFAIGVNLFLAFAERAARVVARPAGVRRVDARSCITRRRKMRRRARRWRSKRRCAKAGYAAPIDVSSSRAGSIPGTHTVGFDAPPRRSR